MNKSLKWTLLIITVLAAAFIIVKMKGGGNKIEKVSTEKAARRTIVEAVSTNGKIYPETEVRVSPDFGRGRESDKTREGAADPGSSSFALGVNG